MPSSLPSACGTLASLTCGTAETREALLDAVREAKGRGAIRPAESVADAVRDVEAFLVVPSWSAGEPAADVAACALRSTFGVEPSAAPLAWSLYSEAARRLGFVGPVPVPTLAARLDGETAPPARA